MLILTSHQVNFFTFNSSDNNNNNKYVYYKKKKHLDINMCSIYMYYVLL